MITRNRGLNFSGAQIKRFRDDFIEKLFSDRHLVFTAKRNIATIRFLDHIVGEIEQEVASQIKVKKEFIKLLSTPGIGNILGLTIMLEVGNIGRFPKAGNYSSYSRCVESKKTSNGKKKFDSPMPVAAKGLVQNHMICKLTIGTGMAPTIFWSARAEGAVF